MNDDAHLRSTRLRDAHDVPPTDEELRFAEQYAEALDAYAAGTLDDAERRALERVASRDPRLRAALDDAVFCGDFFARATTPRADPSIETRILAAVDAETRERVQRSPAPRRPVRTWAAWAAAAAVLVLMIQGITSQRIGDDPEATTYVAADGSVFTEDEVRDAAEQMGLAMAVFGRTLDRTTRAVQSELTGELRDHVREPLREGLGRGVHSIPFLRPRGGDQEHSGNLPRPPAGERPLRSRALESAHFGERT
jgi:hypothetical protein